MAALSRGRIQAGGFADVLGRYARDFRGEFGSELLQRRNKLGVTFGAGGHELLVDEILLHDHVGHGAEHRHVGARLQRQPELGKVDEFDAAGIDHDHPGAMLLDGRLHLQADDRVIFGRVRAGHHKDVVLSDLGSGIAHGRGAECLLKRDHASGVA